MNNKFIKVHQSNLRTRYKYFLLKDEFIDENILKNYFEKIKDIKNVRINKKAFSIIFELKEDITSQIETILNNLTIEDLLKSSVKPVVVSPGFIAFIRILLFINSVTVILVSFLNCLER